MGDLELIARWCQWLSARGLSPHTVRLYSYGVFRLFTEHVQGPISSATEDHVVAFLEGVKDRSSAKVQYMRGIRSLFHYAVRRGAVAQDPTTEIRLRKPRRLPPVALDEHELVRYFIAAAWRDPRRAWALMAAFGLGTRRMELAAVRPEDVQDGEVLLRECKYGKQRRVELSRYAAVALEELRPWWNGTVLGGLSKDTITRWAHEAAVDSGLLPKVRGRVAHVLRASFITHLLRNGVPVQVVRDLAGHENIATTNEYAATLSGDRRRAVARLAFDSRGKDQ
jgi:site-specific recombinase XerD